jgi:hypothetical protein
MGFGFGSVVSRRLYPTHKEAMKAFDLWTRKILEDVLRETGAIGAAAACANSRRGRAACRVPETKHAVSNGDGVPYKSTGLWEAGR